MTGQGILDIRHSGLGIAAFIISIVIAVLMFVVFVIAGIMETSTPGGIDPNSTGAAVLGLFMFALMFLGLLAIGLATASLFQENRKKLFSILGIVFAASTILITIVIILIGSI